MAPTRGEAELAIKEFARQSGAKYPRALKSIEDSKERLLAFYRFPAQHWSHIRTTNIIESIFSGVRRRTDKTGGMCGVNTVAAMVFKLVETASKKFRKITAFGLLKDVLKGETFMDGLPAKKEKNGKK